MNLEAEWEIRGYGPDCPTCGNDLGDPIDMTFDQDNMKQTGNIYKCTQCDVLWLYVHDLVHRDIRDLAPTPVLT